MFSLRDQSDQWCGWTEKQVSVLRLKCKVFTCSAIGIEPRSGFPSLVFIKVSACPLSPLARPGSLRSTPEMALSGFNFFHPLAFHPRNNSPSRSFFSTPDVSVYEARLYRYSFGLRGDADLMVEDFFGNWAGLITLLNQLLLDFAFYKRHLGGIVLLHSEILRFSKDLKFFKFHAISSTWRRWWSKHGEWGGQGWRQGQRTGD